MKFPKIICSSIIRSSHQGESHGGAYLVDLDTGEYKQVVDWNDASINWGGRGGDRGLRGIAIYDNKIYMASNNEIIVFDKNFKIVNSIKNKYLGDVHEIFLFKDSLFITATAFNSILEFDLKSNTFVKGYWIKQKKFLNFLDSIAYNLEHRNIKRKFFLAKILRIFKPKLIIFDPNSDNGPTRQILFHINNVYCVNERIYFCGTRLNYIYYIVNEKIYPYAKVPFHNHNVRPFKGGILLNDTFADMISYMDLKGNVIESFQIKKFKKNELLNAHFRKARQAFGRGLCITDDELIIGGSSPALITVYKLGCPKALKHVNITMDVRNTIHGLEIWPY